MNAKIGIAITMLPLATTTHAQEVIDFDDLTLPSSESYYNGNDGAAGFQSGDVYFHNSYISGNGWESWDGFAYSNMSDTVTEGRDNQFSAITGSGVGEGDDNYAVAYFSSYAEMFFNRKPTILFQEAQTISGFNITNTTYAVLSMKKGDAYAKIFGGETGTDADWFKATFTGFLEDEAVGAVDFYLADYRLDNSAEDYIVDTWEWGDLSSLGIVDQVEITMASSDTGGAGINTPTYVAIDNITLVPEPASFAMLGLAGWAMLLRRRKYNKTSPFPVCCR